MSCLQCLVPLNILLKGSLLWSSIRGGAPGFPPTSLTAPPLAYTDSFNYCTNARACALMCLCYIAKSGDRARNLVVRRQSSLGKVYKASVSAQNRNRSPSTTPSSKDRGHYHFCPGKRRKGVEHPLSKWWE